MRRRVLSVIGCLAATSCATRQATRAPLPLTPATAVQRAMERQVKAERSVRNAFDLGEGDAESRMLRERLIAAPQDQETRARLAARYEELGLPELAIEHYRISAERAPSDSVAQLRMAQTLDRSGRTKLAATTMEAYLSTYADEAPADAHSWAGIFRDRLGDVPAGEKHHRAALRIEPGKAYLHNNLGQNLLLQQRAKEAAEAFSAALQLEPRSEIARNNMAAALASDPAEAIRHLKSVSDPSTAHNNLAAILIEQGRFDDARKQLNLALGYRADNIAALKNLTLVSELDGRPAQWTLPDSAAAGGAQSATRWQKMNRALAKIFVKSEPAEQRQKSAKRAGRVGKPSSRSSL